MLYGKLGLPATATNEEIKTQYRKLALIYHPDKNGGPDARAHFEAINEAYQILSDPKTRMAYDNQFKPKINPTKSNEIPNIVVPCTLEDIYWGISKNVPYQHQVICDNCIGSGYGEISFVTCHDCRGKGVIYHNLSILNSAITTCLACSGLGCRNQNNRCYQCGGNGMSEVTKSLSVKIPREMYQKYDLTLDGKTLLPLNPQFSRPVSNILWINLREVNHPRFRRVNHYDLSTTIKISLYEALVGFTTSLETISGAFISFKVGPTQSPETIHLIKNHGMPYPQSEIRKYGDLYLILQVVFPNHHLDPEILKEIMYQPLATNSYRVQAPIIETSPYYGDFALFQRQ